MACPGAKLNPLASEFIWHGNKTGHMRVTKKGVSAKDANQVKVSEKNVLTKDTEQVSWTRQSSYHTDNP